MDKWIKNGCEYRYEFSRDSGEKFVIRMDHRDGRPGYALVWQYRDGSGYWHEQPLGEQFATLRHAKEYAAMIYPEMAEPIRTNS